MPTIGAEISGPRRRRGISQAQLSLRCGVSIHRISEMEAGGNPRIDDLLAVVGALGLVLGECVRHPRREGAWTPRPEL